MAYRVPRTVGQPATAAVSVSVPDGHETPTRFQFTTKRLMVLVVVAAVELALLRADLVFGAWVLSMSIVVGLTMLEFQHRARRKRRTPTWRRLAFFVLCMAVMLFGTAGVIWALTFGPWWLRS
jgi:uncharacterized membrane protein YoaK (UPF0700 family)